MLISYESQRFWWQPMGAVERVWRAALIGAVSIINPWPRKIKVVRNGKYVLDIRNRRKNRIFQEREINRRIAAGEEAQKCFKIGLKGEADFSGKTG